jgi:glycosyltransferase involved in cell wall biosynthesis
MVVKALVDGCIFETYPHGGIARIYRELLPRVAELREEIEIRVLARNAEDHLLPEHERIVPWRFRPWNLRPSRMFSRLDQWRRRQVDESMRKWRPDIFQSTYYTSSPVSSAKSVALVYDLIDDQFPLMMPNGPGFVTRQSAVLKKAGAVVGISNATTEAAIARFNLDSRVATTIYLDASRVFGLVQKNERLEFRAAHVRGRSFFLFVGSTGFYKNLGTLIRAFAELRDARDQALVLAGHSMAHLEPHLFDLAIQLRVEDRIVRLVHPDDELLCQAYNAADAFVFPSLQEGFGIPLVEAMRCGTPVVASDIPVFREVCGEAALFFDPHDHQALARQLVLVRQPDVRERLVALGYERARRFSWDRAAEQLAEIYLRLAGARG